MPISAQARIERGQLAERFVDRQHLVLADRQGVDEAAVEGQVAGAAAAPLGDAGAREVDHDRAHRGRRVSEEVQPVGRLQPLRGGELEIALVDQRGRVEQRAALVAREALAGNAPQLGIERLEQLGDRLSVAFLGLAEQPGDVAHRRVAAARAPPFA
jgi:hypothetical protein